jgi:hypothetical protein
MPRIPGLKTHRNAELGLLIFAMILVAVFGATVEANQLDTLTSTFWVPAALLTALFLGLHLVVRFMAPYADPVLLPAVALVNGLGVAFLRRLDLARAIADGNPAPGIFSGTGGRQLAWTLASLILAAVLGPQDRFPVRVHARSRRHRAGDAPRRAAVQHLRDQRRQAVDPVRLVLDPAR